MSHGGEHKRKVVNVNILYHIENYKNHYSEKGMVYSRLLESERIEQNKNNGISLSPLSPSVGFYSQ
jgi:hypothetical protein